MNGGRSQYFVELEKTGFGGDIFGAVVVSGNPVDCAKKRKRVAR